ncbi:MAG: Mth938-like domain-containing protein [Pseudomonadota bacterium]
MEFQRETAPGQQIEGYGEQGFRIAGLRHSGAVFVTPEKAEAWDVERFEDLTVEAFSSVLKSRSEFDILLIGTGSEFALLPFPLRTALEATGLSVDAMTTGAAARTYNVLMVEGRRVAAALLPVSEANSVHESTA